MAKKRVLIRNFIENFLISIPGDTPNDHAVISSVYSILTDLSFINLWFPPE